MTLRVLPSLLIAIVASLPLSAQTPSVEDVARGFYRAYASGDLAAATAFWTKDDGPAFAAREARTLRVRCLTLHALEIGDVAIDGDEATARADAWMTRSSALPRSTEENGRERATLRLRRENGAWRIASWVAAEEELAQHEDLPAEPFLWNRRLVIAWDRRAIALRNQERMDLAMRILGLAKEVAESSGDDAALADVLSAESVLRRAPPFNDPVTSLRLALDAQTLAGRARDPDVLARVLLRLGNAQMANRLDADIESFERVLALADYLEPSVLALAASGVTRSYLRDARLRDALRTGIAAVKWAEEAGDPAAIVSAEMTLAGCYLDRRDPALALPHATRAAELAQKAGMPSVHVSALNLISICAMLDGDLVRYGQVIDQALDELGAGDPRTAIELLAHRVELRQYLGDSIGADADLEKAFALLPTVRSQPDASWLHTMAAETRLRQGRFDDALAHVEEAERLRPILGMKAARARIFAAVGRRDEARRLFEEAIDFNESSRSGIDDEVQRSLYWGWLSGDYVSFVELLVEMQQPREALAIAERMKGRVLKDLLSDRSRNAAPGAAVEERNERVTALNRELLAIERDGGDAASVQARLRAARGALDEAQVGAELPRTTPMTTAPSLDLRTIRVPEDTVVLDYVVGAQRTTILVARNVNGDTSVTAHAIDISAQELRQRVRDFARQIEQRDLRYAPAARKLYDLLVAPALGAVPSSAHLCIIPDSTLWSLPFQALIAGDGRHLIEHAVLYYSPSLANLDVASQPRRTHAPTMLALGDPEVEARMRSEVRSLAGASVLGRLPDAEREVRALGRIYGSRATVRVGREAQETLLKKNGGNYDVVHLATHGIVDEHTPMYSSLLLAGSDADDGLLEAREIVDLPWHADLVVLSACDTARGRIVTGEGVLGVSWAMLATGTPRAIATQWPVNSAATARLMIAFHRRLARLPSVTKVAATLRDAQLELLHNPATAHPHEWAAFVLIGSDR